LTYPQISQYFMSQVNKLKVAHDMAALPAMQISSQGFAAEEVAAAQGEGVLVAGKPSAVSLLTTLLPSTMLLSMIRADVLLWWEVFSTMQGFHSRA
jgi:hypothetical protein